MSDNPIPDKGSEAIEDSNIVKMPKADFNDRIRQNAANTEKKLFETVGVSGLDELKTLIETAKTLSDEKQQSELAKLGELDRLKKEHDAAYKTLSQERDTLKTALETANQALEKVQGEQRRGTVEKAILAKAANAQDKDDVVMWIGAKQGDLLTLYDGEASKVNEKAIEDLVKECEKAKPSWFKSTQPSIPSNAGARPPQGAIKTEQIYTRKGW